MTMSSSSPRRARLAARGESAADVLDGGWLQFLRAGPDRNFSHTSFSYKPTSEKGGKRERGDDGQLGLPLGERSSHEAGGRGRVSHIWEADGQHNSLVRQCGPF